MVDSEVRVERLVWSQKRRWSLQLGFYFPESLLYVTHDADDRTTSESVSAALHTGSDPQPALSQRPGVSLTTST